MTIKIDVARDLEARLREEAARQGQTAERYLTELVTRHLVFRELEALKDRKPPQSPDEIQPRIPPPPGKSWIEGVRGQWPGDETDEEIDRILDEMS